MANIELYQQADQLIDRVSVELGLGQQPSPYTSIDPNIIQLTYFLNSLGQELLANNTWQRFQRSYSFVTAVPPDTGVYDLPPDFDHMIEQTQWDRTNALPIYGSLSPQDWEYLQGRQLANQTIYASFRQAEGKFSLYPQPPSDGITVAFEYMSRGWVQSAADPTVYQDHVEVSGDLVLYEPSLMISGLMLKFYSSKGFDTTKAESVYNRAFQSAVSKDVAAPKLSAGRGVVGFPYLNSYTNVPSTGYGTP